MGEPFRGDLPGALQSLSDTPMVPTDLMYYFLPLLPVPAAPACATRSSHIHRPPWCAILTYTFFPSLASLPRLLPPWPPAVRLLPVLHAGLPEHLCELLGELADDCRVCGRGLYLGGLPPACGLHRPSGPLLPLLHHLPVHWHNLLARGMSICFALWRAAPMAQHTFFLTQIV